MHSATLDRSPLGAMELRQEMGAVVSHFARRPQNLGKELGGVKAMAKERPLRKILSRREYVTKSHPRGTYSMALTLECGHTVHCKGSQEPKHRCRCYWCDMDKST